MIEVLLSHQNVIRSKHKLVRTSVADPRIAEPIVVGEDQFVLNGKTLGTTTLALWDEKGNVIVKDVKVVRELTKNSKASSWHWAVNLLALIGFVASAKWITCFVFRICKKSQQKSEEKPEEKSQEKLKDEGDESSLESKSENARVEAG